MDDRRAAHNALVLCSAMQKQDPFAFLNSAPPNQHSLPAAVQRPAPGRPPQGSGGRWHDVAFLCLPRGELLPSPAFSPRPLAHPRTHTHTHTHTVRHVCAFFFARALLMQVYVSLSASRPGSRCELACAASDRGQSGKRQRYALSQSLFIF
jgi:hypothetical protein